MTPEERLDLKMEIGLGIVQTFMEHDTNPKDALEILEEVVADMKKEPLP